MASASARPWKAAVYDVRNALTLARGDQQTRLTRRICFPNRGLRRGAAMAQLALGMARSTMNLAEEADDIAFRQEVIGFIERSLTPELTLRTDGAQLSTRAQTLGWQRLLFGQGWGAPHWPRIHGGTGWKPLWRLIFDIETALAGAPAINQQGMNLLGPIVNSYGTDAQRQRLVGPLVRGETYWCQGFSEPGAGSDLASLQTSARRQGDDYIVNGQKIWTSHAENADWIFLLVRTEKSTRKQLGITFLVAPLNTPGITVRPIWSIDGLHHLTEVFLEDVRIPLENCIGKPGEGWTLAKALLGKERIFGACDLPGMLRELHRLKHLAARSLQSRTPQERGALLQRLARLDIEAEVTAVAFLRAISVTTFEDLDEVTLASILKVQVTELHQKIVECLYDVLGDRGPLFFPDPTGRDHPLPLAELDPDLSKVAAELMYRRASSIYGGTSEIQREIIAKAIIAG